jgi:hypothetical protein
MFPGPPCHPPLSDAGVVIPCHTGVLYGFLGHLFAHITPVHNLPWIIRSSGSPTTIGLAGLSLIKQIDTHVLERVAKLDYRLQVVPADE